MLWWGRGHWRDATVDPTVLVLFSNCWTISFKLHPGSVPFDTERLKFVLLSVRYCLRHKHSKPHRRLEG